MTPPEYRATIAALGLTQSEAARKLGIGVRTSHGYATTTNAPEKIRLALMALEMQK